MNKNNPVYFDRYNEIIANTPFLSLIGTDIDGKIIYFNKGAEDLLGYTGDEILHKETPLLFHDKDELNL